MPRIGDSRFHKADFSTRSAYTRSRFQVGKLSEEGSYAHTLKPNHRNFGGIHENENTGARILERKKYSKFHNMRGCVSYKR